MGKKVRIKDTGIVVTGKTPTTKDETNFNGDILFITPADIAKGYIIEKSERTISQKGFDSISSNTIKGTSVLVGCIGSDMGNVAITELTCASNQQINSITNIREEYNPFYVYYNLSLRKSYLRQVAGTTTTPILPKSVFEEICIDFPDRKKQDNIVKTCRALDEKIRLNNKINEELEKLAKTLYDYWFVQFDFPDENNRPYKSSGGKMIYNDVLKREIPIDWCPNTIEQIEHQIITGKTPNTKHKEYYGGKIPFITIDDIRGNTYITQTSSTLTELGANTQKSKYLPENSICITCIATVGLVGFTTQYSQTNQQINSIICNDINNLEYLYFSIKDYFKYSSGAKTGNTFDNMNKGDFSNIILLNPSNNIKNHFHNMVKNIFKQIKTTSLENQQLIKLRDFLLPMLMNGQVTIQQ